jgi:chemotaxis signal transduction protein
MAHDLSRPMGESNQLLCVRLGDQEFALSIRAIREIRGWISGSVANFRLGAVGYMI